jgi:hypothetical protein
MKTLLTVLAALCLPLFVAAAPAPDTDNPKGEKVAHDVHNGHFVKNTFKPKGDSAYLAFTDRDSFDNVFGIGRVIGGRQNFVPQDAFDKKMVVAAIKVGNAITTYKVEDVRADGKTLYVRYTAKAGAANPTATFASPLIVSLNKGGYSSVVFIENGKKTEKVKVNK